jgi:hypothetical protein
MDRTRKFEEAMSSTIIHINSLEIEKKYLSVKAERTVTKYGPTILLCIKEKTYNTVKVILPRRYSSVMMDEDIAAINSHEVILNLIYKGKCEKSNSYLLAIEK